MGAVHLRGDAGDTHLSRPPAPKQGCTALHTKPRRARGACSVSAHCIRSLARQRAVHESHSQHGWKRPPTSSRCGRCSRSTSCSAARTAAATSRAEQKHRAASLTTGCSGTDLHPPPPSPALHAARKSCLLSFRAAPARSSLRAAAFPTLSLPSQPRPRAVPALPVPSPAGGHSFSPALSAQLPAHSRRSLPSASARGTAGRHRRPQRGPPGAPPVGSGSFPRSALSRCPPALPL